jgi:biofilm protein TabA
MATLSTQWEKTMIFDILENAHLYQSLNSGFAKAIEFLQRPDLKELPVETYEIDGKRIYAMVAKDPGRKKEEALLEAHNKYVDIQLVLDGIDTMGWKPRSACKQATSDYDSEKDVQLFKDTPDTWLATHSGAFAIFFPDDAHMPLIASGILHKVVVKIAVD